MWLRGDESQEVRLKADEIYAPRRILEISIEVKEDDWRKLCNQNRDFIQALRGGSDAKTFTYVPADITIDGQTIRNVGIRKKGFLGSLDTVRPSLKVKFDEYQERTVGEGFQRLTLNNNKQDASRLSQYLSYKFFNDTGSIAPRCNFARVKVNGKSLGIYSNVETMEEEFLEARFGDGSGAFYEGTTTDLFPGTVAKLEAKTKTRATDDLRRLAELLDRDTLVLSDIEQVLDVKAFVRFWATESLLGFWDGYAQNQNNYFLYQVPQTRRWQFIPWGLDSAFTEFIPLPQLKTANQSVYANAQLANRLYRIPEIQRMYAETMKQLLERWNEDEWVAEVDAAAALLRADEEAQSAAFERRVTEIKNFIRKRRATIEKELASGVVTIKHGARRPTEINRVGEAAGTFATTWTERTPASPNEKGKTDLRVELQGNVIEWSKLGVISEPSQDRNAREADGRLPPTVAFHGIRKSDQKQLLLVFSTTSSSFRPSTEPTKVTGIIIEGNPLWFFAKMIAGFGNFSDMVFLSGTVTFDEAAREANAPVSGRVKLELAKFQGGEHLPPR